MVLKDNKAFLLSDDRGLVNEPRFYEFDIRAKGPLWQLESPQLRLIKMPGNPKVKEVLDLESMVAIEKESLLLSSEGDNNKKPRVPPRIFKVDRQGQWEAEISLPPVVLPETTGRQTQGISNNFGFEAMTLSSDGNRLWFVSEAPLVQDIGIKPNKQSFRFFEMEKGPKSFELKAAYFLEVPTVDLQDQLLAVRGWTEMMHLGGLKFWLLERTLFLPSQKFLCRWAEIDLQGASRIEGVKDLATAKNLKSARSLQFQELKSSGNSLGNCEGMAKGPSSGDFKRTLWVLTDNNLSKTTETVLYFFGVKE